MATQKQKQAAARQAQDNRRAVHRAIRNVVITGRTPQGGVPGVPKPPGQSGNK